MRKNEKDQIHTTKGIYTDIQEQNHVSTNIRNALLQLLILVNAATLDMKSIDMYVVDQDLSSLSQKLTNKFEGSPFYNISGSSFSLEDANRAIEKNKTDIIIQIPAGFERTLIRENKAKFNF